MWAAGVQSSPLTATLGVACDRLGRVVVEPTLRVPGHPEVWIVGDAARVATPDGAVPMLIPPAIQMGACAARNVVRSLEGRPPQPFRYKDPGTMATIGRSAAVVHLGRVKLWGFPGWVFWLLVHLVQLIGFRNKLVVLVDWAWQYFFYRAASPLILDAPEAAPRRESK